MTDKRPHRSNLRSNVFAGYFARCTGFLTDGSQKNRSLPHNLLWCQLSQRESFSSRTEILTNSTFCVFTIYLIVLLKMIYANIVKPSNWFASAQSNSGIHWPLWMCLEDVGPAFMSDNFPALGPHIQKWVLNERDSYLDFWLLTEFDIWKTSCLNLHLIYKSTVRNKNRPI